MTQWSCFHEEVCRNTGDTVALYCDLDCEGCIGLCLLIALCAFQSSSVDRAVILKWRVEPSSESLS